MDQAAIPATSSSGVAHPWRKVTLRRVPAAFLGGNIAGFAAIFMIGWMTSLTHSSASALYLFAAIAAAGGVLVLAIPAARVADR